jgi:hypothetical protein
VIVIPGAVTIIVDAYRCSRRATRLAIIQRQGRQSMGDNAITKANASAVERGPELQAPAPLVEPTSPYGRGWAVVFALALLVNAAAGYWFDKPAILVANAAALLLAMAFTQLDRFKRIKGAGIEAEMRELRETKREAQEATQQATATLEQLRETSATLGAIVLDILGLEGVMGTIETPARIEKKDRVLESLRAIGCDDAMISRATDLFDRILRFRHAGKVRETASRVWHAANPGLLTAEYRKIDKRIDPAVFLRGEPTPASELRTNIAALGLASDDIEARLADYEHYEKHHTLRRPEALE